MVVGSVLRRALRVQVGTYDALAAKAATSASVVPVRLVDGLDLPELAARADRVIPMPTPAGHRGFFPAVKPGPSSLAVGRRSIRGRGILDWLTAAGVELEVQSGRLLVRAPRGRMLYGTRTVIERAERLLIGWLAELPVACELTHTGTAPEATTVALGGLAVCAEHLAGEAS